MPPPIALLHYISPALTLLPFLTILTKPSPPLSFIPGIRPIITERITPRRWLILFLLLAISTSYLLDGLVFALELVINGVWQDFACFAWVAYTLGNVILWSGSSVLISVKDGYRKKALLAIGVFAIILETTIFVFQVITYVKHHARSPWDSIYHPIITAIRILHLPILLWAVSSPIISYQPASPNEQDALLPSSTEEDEAQGLVAPGQNGNVTTYGTLNGQGSTSANVSGANSTMTLGGDAKKSGKDGKKADESKSGNPPPPTESTWSEYFARLGRIAPFLWPSKSGKLQILAAMCIFILILGRGVNVLVPQTLGRVVAALSSWERESGQHKAPWWPIGTYIVLRFCQGGGGVLSVLQSIIWAPVMQYADREMSIMSFNHLLDLSLAFHTKRKTGEVLRILDRGSAINNIFQTLLMQVSPVVFDIGIACIYFYAAYGWSLALVIAVVMMAYITVSITLTTWRTGLRRQMVERDVKTRGISADVLMNWESVKYFVSETRESERYTEAIKAYQEVEFKVIGSLNILNLTQQAIITSGLLAGTLIVAYRVTQGRASAAEFVVFLTYIGQLYAPLNMLGMIYRQLNSGLVDAEKLLKLLEEETEVVDDPAAKDLVVTDGVIEFRNVYFSYDGKVDALKDVSFKIEKGNSVALVGESGSGKSSLLRLLYRFYDIQSGEILIDGQNIRDVTQTSLRRAIGIVPQDAVLWNDTIGFNIGYGKDHATQDEIEDAAKAAKLHDRIMGFPDGYQTVVGERGVRLSGGEKQRVSLARTMLKAPAILVLDEATSALDTMTERFVQEKLAELAKGRSSLMIAHRLSTIVDADQIIVLKDGRIIESGNHGELVNKVDGVFSQLWKEQISSNHLGIEGEDSPPADLKIPDELFAQAGKTATPSNLSKVSEGQEEEEPKEPKYVHQGSSRMLVAQEPEVEPFAVDVTAAPQMESQAMETTVSALKDVEGTKISGAEKEDLGESYTSPIPQHSVLSTSASQTDLGVSPQSVASSYPQPGLTKSASDASGISSQAVQLPGMPRSMSSDLTPPDSPESKKDKRNRLGSIGGLVRRVSEQGKDFIRNGGDGSPGASGEGGKRSKRISLKSKADK